MQYQFFDPGDEKLIEVSEMAVDDGIAVALRTTGYNAEEDEVLELAVVSLSGEELFAKAVKPQNVEEWQPGDASGGLTPADVADASELYQFEEELSDLFENAGIVVMQHMPFVKAMIEQSWVTLPEFTGFDVVEGFRESHCTDDYRNEVAAAASLQGILDYYHLPAPSESLVDEARAVAKAYHALVAEHVEQRAAKGDSYWKARDERLAQEATRDDGARAAAAMREKNFNRMNGLLWVAATIIFVSLVIQLYQRGGDIGFMVVCAAFAVFALSRAIVNFRR